jgi:hypothetical protein
MTQSGMSGFTAYTAHLTDTLTRVLSGAPVSDEHLAASLDGEAAHQMRQLVPLSYRREVGAFFTTGRHRAAFGSALSELRADRFLDPACGAGDLLLAASVHLPLGSTLADTLERWGSQLTGWDLHQELIDATRLRLILAATLRHMSSDQRLDLSDASKLIPERAFPTITVGDGLTGIMEAGEQGTVVLLNPPFGTVPAPSDCRWSTGATSRAALFAEAALAGSTPGSQLVAILPDVLRSGSRYHGWRRLVETQTDVVRIEHLGLFDNHTDVDVFLLQAVRRPIGPSSRAVPWWPTRSSAQDRVSDHFEVHVGSVVDNRDPLMGEEHPFLIARDLPPTGTVGVPTRRRRFTGRLFIPPFVVLRRTSRPSSNGEVRAAGVLITGTMPIAVDNHLLVAIPRNGNMTSCHRLLELLATEHTTQLLDDRIRCRHMTVAAIKDLAWTTGLFSPT